MTRRVRFPDMSRRAPERLVDLDSAALSPLPIADPPPDRRHTPAVPPKPARSRFPRRRRARADAAPPGNAGRRRRARPPVPGGAREALLPRQQLDVPAAAAPDDGALRPLPDLLGGVPHLRGERRRRDLPADLPLRGPPPPVLPARQAAAACVSAWQHGTVELNWPLVARLAELAYRCNLCRRCAQTCPIGVDNGLDRARNPQAVQPGAGHRAEGAARVGLDAAAEGRARRPA